jgi:hypothetical protein
MVRVYRNKKQNPPMAGQRSKAVAEGLLGKVYSQHDGVVIHLFKRNSPCPCGSQYRYRDCCESNNRVFNQSPTNQELDRMEEMQAQGVNFDE